MARENVFSNLELAESTWWCVLSKGGRCLQMDHFGHRNRHWWCQRRSVAATPSSIEPSTRERTAKGSVTRPERRAHFCTDEHHCMQKFIDDTLTGHQILEFARSFIDVAGATRDVRIMEAQRGSRGTPEGAGHTRSTQCNPKSRCIQQMTRAHKIFLHFETPRVNVGLLEHSIVTRSFSNGRIFLCSSSTPTWKPAHFESVLRLALFAEIARCSELHV